MTDFIVVAILAVIIGAAVRYIYKEKKRGATCIGCTAGGCSGACSCSCGNEAGKEASPSCCCHTDET